MEKKKTQINRLYNQQLVFENCKLLGSDAVWSCRSVQKFHRNVLPIPAAYIETSCSSEILPHPTTSWNILEDNNPCSQCCQNLKNGLTFGTIPA
jgi:hypothetical protein